MDAEDIISPTPPPDKVFRIALLVVLAFGAAQIAGLGVFYINKWRTEYAAAHPKVEPARRHDPRADRGACCCRNDARVPADVRTSLNSRARGPFGRRSGFSRKPPVLRDKGDTTSALARLQEASQRDPKNANVLAEMAMIYESIQLFDRSNEHLEKDPGDRAFGRPAL